MDPRTSADLAAARDPRATAASANHEQLRGAYLELLKLSLCDLAGASTISVGRMEDGRLISRRLVGEEQRVRSLGMDWPLQGLTMVGLARLDDLQLCVESIVQDGVEGDLIEAGAWRGGASILMRATLDCVGPEDREVWVADSFQGFPSAEADGISASHELDDPASFEFLCVPLEEVRAHFARLGCDQGVEFVPGFFGETMPLMRGRRWSLIRLDGDTYEATRLTLDALYPGLAAGGYLIVDDYGAVDDCRRAVDEYRAKNGIDEPLEQIDWTCVRWRRESEAPTANLLSAADVPSAAEQKPQAGVARGPGGNIPSARERMLEDELAATRARLAEAQVEGSRGPMDRAASLARRIVGRDR